MTPVVALSTKTTSSASAPTNAATDSGGAAHALSAPDRGIADEAGDVTQQEARRLALHLVADRLLRCQHATRRDADRAVIEIGHVRIERPVREHRTAE